MNEDYSVGVPNGSNRKRVSKPWRHKPAIGCFERMARNNYAFTDVGIVVPGRCCRCVLEHRGVVRLRPSSERLRLRGGSSAQASTEEHAVQVARQPPVEERMVGHVAVVAEAPVAGSGAFGRVVGLSS